ncbi:MAG TPA: hypothetical protein VF499_04245 [Afipia sp.]
MVEVTCKRCGKAFSYPHKTKPRLYCGPCIPKRRKEWNDESNQFQSEMRKRHREEAKAAHAARTA